MSKQAESRNITIRNGVEIIRPIAPENSRDEAFGVALYDFAVAMASMDATLSRHQRRNGRPQNRKDT